MCALFFGFHYGGVGFYLFALAISPLQFGRPDDWPVSLWGAGRVGACKPGMTMSKISFGFGFVSMEI